MFLANRLKNCRRKTGLSLENLAYELRKKTGHRVSRQTLENWEKGRFSPTVDGLLSICDFFDQPLGYFFSSKSSLTSEAYKKD